MISESRLETQTRTKLEHHTILNDFPLYLNYRSCGAKIYLTNQPTNLNINSTNKRHACWYICNLAIEDNLDGENYAAMSTSLLVVEQQEQPLKVDDEKWFCRRQLQSLLPSSP